MMEGREEKEEGAASELLLRNYRLISNPLGPGTESAADTDPTSSVKAAETLTEDIEGATDLCQGREGATDLSQDREGATDLSQDREGATDLSQDREGATDLYQDREGATDLSQNLALPSSTCRCSRDMESVQIRINLRGVTFVLDKRNLVVQSPLSTLACLCPTDESFDSSKAEYYFDRNPTVFNSILDYYASGEMHLASSVCIQAFRKELEFWNLDPELLAPCCWSKYRKAEEEEKTLDRVQREWGAFNPESDYTLNQKTTTLAKIWIFMNIPQSSTSAKFWSLFMILMIGISIAVLSLETVISLREAPDWFWEKLPNVTERKLVFVLENSEPHVALVWVEVLTLLVLTAEFFMRFISCPEKKTFCKSFLNIADVIGIMPIWVMIILYFSETELQGREKGAIVFAYYFMMCLRLLRVFRLFKLVKHYKTLKILLLAIKASYRELLLLVILLTMGVIIYANLVYFVEVEYDNFMSIPEGFWWAIVTMTTVGYGDIYPKSGLGYLVGSLCAITGILVIALPVPVIANNFSTYYQSALAWERMSTKASPGSPLNDVNDVNKRKSIGNSKKESEKNNEEESDIV